MKVRTSTSLAALLLLIACARGEDAGTLDNAAIDNLAQEAMIDDVDPTANASAESFPTDAWIGKWIGVEGTVLDIQAAGEAGHYVLSVTLLDGTSSYDGAAEGDLIRFTRNGRPESVRAATGAETGLKWLAEKKNCVMIQQGEGFCRDDVAAAAPARP